MKRVALTLVALALCLAPPLSGQRAGRRLFVSATDGSGTPVLNLSAADFQVVENGVPREVLRATRGTGPMRIALTMPV